MVLSIEQDLNRFKKIVKNKIRKDLNRYISHSELIGKKGKQLVRIPVNEIDIPDFRYDRNKQKGVGQGEGEIGEPIGVGEPEEGGNGKAGDRPGEHILEVEITLEELASILSEELELPRIVPKSEKGLTAEKAKYTGINKIGPESLKHFKRTYKQALRRHILTGSYDPNNPLIVPIQEDKRYRTFKLKLNPFSQAVIFLMMDISGSIGENEKEIVRLETFWIDTWLRANYKGIKTRYIVHEAIAKEVSRETFFSLSTSGGTLISTAYELCYDIIMREHNPLDWNIYVFHFSDGDNWSREDTSKCIRILSDNLLPISNLVGYGQVESSQSGGRFFDELKEEVISRDNFLLSRINSKEAVLDSLKEFFGKGK